MNNFLQSVFAPGTLPPSPSLMVFWKKLSCQQASTIFLCIHRINRVLFLFFLQNISKGKESSWELKMLLPESLSFLLYCFLWHVALLKGRCPSITEERQGERLFSFNFCSFFYFKRKTISVQIPGMILINISLSL